MSKLINAIIIKTRFEGDRMDVSVTEKLINPKESTYKKIMGIPEPKICGCSLKSVFPGHTMRILDDEDPKMRKAMQKLPKWIFMDHDAEIFGNAVIYRLVDSEPANVEVTIRDVQACLVMLGK